VISNEPDAAGLEFARSHGIATVIVNHRDFTIRDAFGNALDQSLQASKVEIVCLAGFMRMLANSFVERWKGRLINIHPSLLPAFKGLDTHARALAAGEKTHGCTVHFVVPELDSGPIILQAEVPVLSGDDEQSLAARVLVEEHRIYPEALRSVAEGRAKLGD
jgi:phosphoribosylglycinamide formyltransferase-1